MRRVHMAELNICRGNLLADEKREEGEEDREDGEMMDDDDDGPGSALVQSGSQGSQGWAILV